VDSVELAQPLVYVQEHNKEEGGGKNKSRRRLKHLRDKHPSATIL